MNRFEYIVNTSRDFITLINRKYQYEVANEAYCHVTGKKQSEILLHTVAEIWGEEKFTQKIKPNLDKCLGGQEIHLMEKFQWGQFEKYMHVSFYPYRDEGKSITHALVFSHDITQIKELESKLIDFEYKDPVTGLFNRRSLELVLDLEISKYMEGHTTRHLGLIFFNLENFSKINQNLGHETGDMIMENTGLRIRDALRDSDFVFRYEGKEFAVIITNLTEAIDAYTIAQKILHAIALPYQHGQQTVTIKAHAGISLFPDDGEDVQSMIRNAYFAKNSAKSQDGKIQIYNKDLHQKAYEKHTIETDLHRAFNDDHFELYYQPIVSMEGQILGAEALIRWNHPEKGLIPPGDFIHLASEFGLIEAIGKWALFSGCYQLSKWINLYPIYLSVNLSPREFENKNLIEIILSALKNAHDLDPVHLKLEITETESMKKPEETIQKINLLKKIGIEVFIDDFGTGQSSLGYLKLIPSDVIKIDRLFIEDMVKSKDDLDYVVNIIHMIKSKNKKVLAEGVSSREIYETLKKVECDKLQGYFFSKPVPANVFESYLKKGGHLPETS